MITSARRIGATLLLISVVSLTFSFASIVVTKCTSKYSCLSAILLYKADFTISRSTPSEISDPIYGVKNFVAVNRAIQVTSFYILILALAILIALEFRELHYLKLLFQRRHR